MRQTGPPGDAIGDRTDAGQILFGGFAPQEPADNRLGCAAEMLGHSLQHDLRIVQHHHAVRHLERAREVVRHDDAGDVQLALQPEDQLDNDVIVGYVDHLSEGEIVTGKVIDVTNNHVIIDVGYKSEGLVPISEFSKQDGKLEVTIGDDVDVLLEKAEDVEGLVLLSKKKAERMKVWAAVIAGSLPAARAAFSCTVSSSRPRSRPTVPPLVFQPCARLSSRLRRFFHS